MNERRNPSVRGGVDCHCEKRSDEAISDFASQHEKRDCFAPLAMTFLGCLCLNG